MTTNGPGPVPPGQVQAVPFRLKLDGGVPLLAQVPWKPNETIPPGLIAAS